ncbi:MAG: methyltransferase, CheR-type [Moraxellaceae bacterium]|jgi:chemotaxis protein methyltransferase CheR|nr:methyltransferase, CheR-type [Moraxellaceae bacterium]
MSTLTSPLIAPVAPISDREFRDFQELIYREAGIHLSAIKKALLTGRLAKRMRELQMKRFQDYYAFVTADRSGDELVILLDAITTNETHFFREPRQFDYLEQVVYPEWQRAAESGQRQRRLRIWSAACSTGEEPYSLSMSLLSNFAPEQGWSVDILASDLSTKVLDRARAGVWPLKRADNIPRHLLKRYMLQGSGLQEGKMKAGPEVRLPLEFQRINLNEDSYPVRGGLDAIFCRNVLIYFDTESRTRVINRLLDLLSPDGLLFLGHAESLTGLNDRVRALAPAIYCLRDRPTPGATR